MRQLAAASVLITLAACAVGPEYTPPAPPAAAVAPLVGAGTTSISTVAAADYWWRLFDDTRLDALVREAFAANDDLKIAEANLGGARAVFEAARSGLYPRTGVALGATYGRDPATDEILEIEHAKPQSIWIFDDLLDVSYELDLFGHVRHSVEQAKAATQVAIAQRDAVRVTVAAETARAYAQLCALGEELAVARHSLDLVTHEAEITAKRRAAGAGTDFDVVRSEAIVAQARAAIPPLEGQRRASLFELAALLGRSPANRPIGVDQCDAPPLLTAPLPVGDGTALLKRRPDIRAAERRLAAAVAGVGVATAELYPRISLTGFYGGVDGSISQLGTNNGLAWGVGPSISWPFPIQSGPRAKVHHAQAAANAALAAFDGIVLQAVKETAEAISAYTAELDHHRELVAVQMKSRSAFDLARDQLSAGAISELDFLTSERAVVSADAAVAASDAAVVQDQIAVFKALGGGWQKASPRNEGG